MTAASEGKHHLSINLKEVLTNCQMRQEARAYSRLFSAGRRTADQD